MDWRIVKKGAGSRAAGPAAIFLMLIAVSVFGEAAIIYLLPELPFPRLATLDAAFHAIILFPLVYILLYRPFVLQISELDEKESKLRELNESLEAKVGARTRELGELNAEMKAILDYSSDAILRVDGSGMVQSVNKRAVEILRYRMSALRGMAISDIFPIDAQRLVVDSFIASLGSWSGTPVENRIEVEAKRGDGTLFPVELGVSDCVIKGVPFSIMIVRDITERKQAESAIRERHERLRAVMDNSAAAIFMKDRDGAYIMANNCFAGIAGKGEKQVIGKKDWELFPEHHARRFREDDERVRQSGQTLRFEEEVDTHGGKAIFLTTKFPLFDEKGNIYAVGGIATDITGQKLIEEELRRSKSGLSKAQEIAQVGNWDWDVDSGGMYWSPQAYRNFGFEPGAVSPAYRVMVDAIHPNDRAFLKKAFYEAIFENVPLDAEVRAGSSGEPKYLHFIGEAVLDDRREPAHLIGTVQDVTHGKLLENDLRKAKEAAEEATRLKDKFVALVSHDLRTPLTTVTGYLKLLYRDMEALSVGEIKEFLTYGLDGAEKMLTLIEEMLSISRLQSGKMQLNREFIDANYLAIKTVSTFLPVAEKKGIDIVNDVPRHTRIYADDALITQVVENLISNAIKFSKRGGKITLFMRKEIPFALAVKDDGIGIEQKRLGDLFRYEVRTSTVGTAGETGTGFGLPLSNDIVNAHGGNIRVESVSGKGSVFYLELPHVVPRVLIVEDDPHLRQLIKHYLSDLKVEILEAESAEEARNMMTSGEYPHLMLLDVNLPGITGIEFLEHIRKDFDVKALPVIVMTAETGVEIKENAFRTGANDFVNKPVDAADLIPRIRRYIA